MSKNDYVKIFVRDITAPFEVTARQNGRRIELEVEKAEVIATEITRGGTVVRKVWFPRSEVIAVESEISE